MSTVHANGPVSRQPAATKFYRAASVCRIHRRKQEIAIAEIGAVNAIGKSTVPAGSPQIILLKRNNLSFLCMLASER
jgi:hypothetical protein